MKQQFADLVFELKRQIPGFRIRYKDRSRLMSFLGKLLFFNKSFMTTYTTTWGRAVYFPSEHWVNTMGPDRVYRILRHEAVHLRDAKRFPVLFQVSYLLLLPAVFTLRALWEYRAYKETIRAFYEMERYVSSGLIKHIVKQFTGPAYFWMFPFKRFLTRRLERFVDDLKEEYRQKVSNGPSGIPASLRKRRR